ncbi:DNA polymerase III subunit gamma/tau [Derxia gummosa]|uniref:DNA-directed DNA polymerase n=1 Tax=Derxia gummosa DSM 723 TaxID=1121388 RepID=A0A8B6X262_9BURK|nr:DNA polymerase III subunit gamma/tau [Derxia gummosa]
MSYLVLARKYRSRNFAEVVGQEHVVRALRHALEQKRLHHAWLFTGTRGVGKTTLSRILAKALNCVGADGQGDITPEPCGVCEACRAIDAGRFVDYVEMDAASNRGVEEMTALLERSVYAPTNARFKVFMIDEVHMLSNHAFNAMLKTLEEPPAHLKFILATTDPQKVPVTVLSRCLQFNLKQMPPGHIVEHLGNVLGAEGIPFEPNALRLLSQAAHGSMRDALSLTDQAIAYSAGPVAEATVRAMLGAIDTGYLVRIADALLAEDGATLMAIVAEMAERSVGYAGALQELALLFQRVALVRMVPAALPDDLPEVDDIRRLAAAFDPQEAQLHYDIAIRGRRDLPLAPDERAGFEMTLLRMLAFRPARSGETVTVSGGGSAPVAPPPSRPAALVAPSPASTTVARVAVPKPAPMPAIAPAPVGSTSPDARTGRVAPAAVEAAAVEAAPAKLPAEPIAPEAMPASEASASAAAPADAGIPFDPPYVARATVTPAAASPATVPQQRVPAPSVDDRPAPADIAAPMSALGRGLPARDADGEGWSAPRPASGNAKAVLDLLKGRGSGAAIRRPAPAPAQAQAASAPSDAVPALPAAQPRPTQGAVPGTVAQPADLPSYDEDDPGYDDSCDTSSADAGYLPDIDPSDYADWPDDGAAARGATRGNGAFGERAGGQTGWTASAGQRRPPRAPSPAVAALLAIDDWPSYASELDLKGLPRELARQTELVTIEGDTLRLRVENPALGEAAIANRLVAALRERSGKPVRLVIETGPVTDSAGLRRIAANAERQREAEDGFLNDPFVKTLLEHGATIVPGSIKPLEDSR